MKRAAPLTGRKRWTGSYQQRTLLYPAWKQMRHYLSSLQWTSETRAAESAFATKLFDTALLKNTISGWAKLGRTLQADSRLEYLAAKWSNELNMPLSPKYMEQCFMALHRQIKDIGLCEVQFKILHRIYCTDVRRFQMGCMDSPLCIKCRAVEGTLLHLLFRCPTLTAFWGSVSDVILQCTAVSVPVTGQFLLSSPQACSAEINRAKDKFSRVAVLLACRTILSNWAVLDVSLSILAWFQRLVFPLQLEHLDCVLGKCKPDKR
ncbi:uncharacterized protein LOC115091006 [Rhinatrema bivittatum]|uniref:uncharacterized protein LOC115091006 n=1 Tax=Rhinatrema bivittatum TaxID=194408 RepID=UPI00112DABA9|nr:uncharacterized protein LOC115091006 [Rhinatrema bivittatum]